MGLVVMLSSRLARSDMVMRLSMSGSAVGLLACKPPAPPPSKHLQGLDPPQHHRPCTKHLHPWPGICRHITNYLHNTLLRRPLSANILSASNSIFRESVCASVRPTWLLRNCLRQTSSSSHSTLRSSSSTCLSSPRTCSMPFPSMRARCPISSSCEFSRPRDFPLFAHLHP